MVRTYPIGILYPISYILQGISYFNFNTKFEICYPHQPTMLGNRWTKISIKSSLKKMFMIISI